MKYLKKFETIEEAYKAKHSIPFVGSVSGIERKAVFGSKNNIANNGTVLKDKDTGFVKTLPNIVVGKSIRPTSMPYLWYYCSTKLQFMVPSNYERDVDVYLNGEFIHTYSPNDIEYLDINCEYLTRVERFLEGGSINAKCYLETMPFDGNALTTTEGVIIKDYQIINTRPTILRDYHDCENNFYGITTTRPGQRKYLAKYRPTQKFKAISDKGEPYHYHIRKTIGEPYRKFTKQGTCRYRCVMRAVNIAKKRWKSIHPIIFNKMYPLEIWEPNS